MKKFQQKLFLNEKIKLIKKNKGIKQTNKFFNIH